MLQLGAPSGLMVAGIDYPLLDCSVSGGSGGIRVALVLPHALLVLGEKTELLGIGNTAMTWITQ